MKTKEKFEYLNTYNNIPVEISNLSLLEYETLFPEKGLIFLCNKIFDVIEIFLSTPREDESSTRSAFIVDVQEANIKFGMEIRKEVSSYKAIVFDLLDKTKHKYLSDDEKVSLVDDFCKETSCKGNEIYYRFDNESGFEDWVFGSSFYEDGKIVKLYEEISI